MDPDVRNGKITYTVLDPSNLYHTVMYRNDKWYGLVNLVQSIDDNDTKWYTIRKLKQMMLVEVEGKWAGFEWVPLD